MFEFMCKVLGGLVVGIVILAFLFVFSCGATGLWYCFDDALATATETPGLGTVPFWNIYAFTAFVTAVCKNIDYKSLFKKKGS